MVKGEVIQKRNLFKVPEPMPGHDDGVLVEYVRSPNGIH